MQLSTADVILEYLSSINDFVSGREISKIAQRTPQTVSYHIKRLRSFGLDIEVSHRGYKYDRSCDTKLLTLTTKYKEIGIVFEYIRSCLNLVSIFSPQEHNHPKTIYYTFNETESFTQESKGNLSFAIGGFYDIPITDWVIAFMSTYLDSELQQITRNDTTLILYQEYVISLIYRNRDIHHVQIAVNSHRKQAINGIKIKSLSEIIGDFIGIKGFSVLIFENLYANLKGYLLGK